MKTGKYEVNSSSKEMKETRKQAVMRLLLL